MRRFLRYILWFLLPALLLVSTYVILDPFRVLWPIGDERSSYIASSDDYYGVERYLKNKSLGYQYNTFLFGNSKVMAYQEEAVCGGDPNCKFYNFGAPGESLLNIKKKVELILSQGDNIKEAYIILDHKILMNERNRHPNFQGPVYEHHPLISDNTWLSFHSSFFQYFIKDGFFISYLVHKSTGKWFSWMASQFKDPDKFAPNPYNSGNNQVSNSDKNRYSASEFINKMECEGIVINEPSPSQSIILDEIKTLVSERSICFVLGPLLCEAEVNDVLIRKLKTVGEVYDFTNLKIEDSNLWYDANHYSNDVGSEIIKKLRNSTPN